MLNLNNTIKHNFYLAMKKSVHNFEKKPTVHIRPKGENSPKRRKFAQKAKTRPNGENSPKRRQFAQKEKNWPNLVTLAANEIQYFEVSLRDGSS
jgi:hypothetical protein